MSTLPSHSAARIAAEFKWLKANPHFSQRPATVREFIGPDYLNIEEMVRKSIIDELENIIGDAIYPHKITKYSRAIFTGGIGIGKTTIASIVLPYLVHWTACLKDPQRYFNLLPGSRIAFMQMSTSGKQAKEVIFSDIKARINHSPWFRKNLLYDDKFKNQLRFPKDIWILPGDSSETTFEGYNILGGVLDEIDSHKVTDVKDYAEQGYTTISSRITSRFNEKGFLLLIGQTKRANGFAARMYKQFMNDENAYAVRMAIWESFGWDKYTKADGTRDSFWYDIKRKNIVSKEVADLLLGASKGSNLIEVPNLYLQQFRDDPVKALRDLAGIPPATGSAFISMTHKLEEARNRWLIRNNKADLMGRDLDDFKIEDCGIRGPIRDHYEYLPEFEPWFTAPDRLKRVIHIDMAYSANGDALGLAMGHVRDMVEIDGELKPYISFDLLMRVKAPTGTEIQIGDIRRIIYHLRDDRKFNISIVTMDGFQSTDTLQQLRAKRIATELVSVDKSMLPYHDLREAINENRIEWPHYLSKMKASDTVLTEVAYKELSELVDTGRKVDHPDTGSKDVADAMAGVCYTLIGERTYHKKNKTLAEPGDPRSLQVKTGRPVTHPAILNRDGLRAPVSPSVLDVPRRWRPPKRG